MPDTSMHVSKVKDNYQIEKILRFLYDNGSALSLTIDGHEAVAVIATIDPAEGSFQIEFNPPFPTASAVKKQSLFKLETQHRDIQTSFSCKPKRLAFGKDRAVLTLALPTVVSRLERRGAFRVTIPSNKLYQVQVRLPNKQNAAARIRNISVSGVLLEFDTDLSKEVRIEDCLSQSIINVEQHNIKTDLVIKRFAPHAKNDLTQLGCMMSTLQSKDEALISQIVMEIQREQIYSY